MKQTQVTIFEAFDGKQFSTEIECLNYEGKGLTPKQKCAIYLHSKECHSDHHDRCGWYYEIERDERHDWSMWTHNRYLELVDVRDKEYQEFFKILHPDLSIQGSQNE